MLRDVIQCCETFIWLPYHIGREDALGEYFALSKCSSEQLADRNLAHAISHLAFILFVHLADRPAHPQLDENEHFA